MRRADGLQLTPGQPGSTVATGAQPVRQYAMTIVNGTSGRARQETMEAANFIDFADNLDRQSLAPDDVITSVSLVHDGYRQLQTQ
jgi:hypothetical protein